MPTTYAPGDPNTPSHLRTKANGWNGSMYVGTGGGASPTTPTTQTQPYTSPPGTAPKVVGSQGKVAGQWIGSQYIGAPQAAPVAPVVTPTGAPTTVPAAPTAPAVAQAPGMPAPLTKQQYDALTPAQRTQYFAGQISASGTPISSTAPANTSSSANPDKTWLDWIEKTYGRSSSRGGGFADLPAGTNLEQVIARFNQETGSSAKYVGGNSGDRVDFGQGVTDALTGGGQLWSDYGAMSGQARAGANVPNGHGGGGGSGRGINPNDPRLHDGIPGNAGTPIGGGVGAPGTGGDSYDDLIRQLVERSQQSLDVNSANSPAIRAQTDPYRAQVERQKRDYLADIAEKSSPNANMRGEERLSSERAGQAIGLHESNLVGQEIAARRQEIQDALNQRGALMTEAQRQALTRELAQLQDATQRLGIKTSASTARYGQDMNNDQFLRDLGLRADQQDNWWDAFNSGRM